MRENPDKLRERSTVRVPPVISLVRCEGDAANGIDQDGDDLFPHGFSPFPSVLLLLRAVFKRAYRQLLIT